MARRKTRYTGVYERASTVRKFQGKPDVAYDYAIKVDGKLTWKCAGWRSDGVTAAVAADARASAMRMAKATAGSSLTVGQAWEIYWRDWLMEKASARTDGCSYRKHIEPVIGNVMMRDVTPSMVSEIIAGMNDRAPQTKAYVIGIIKRIYNKMILWGLYDGKIPTVGIQVGKVDNNRLRFLSKSEASRLLEELDSRYPVIADICRVSLYAGLRLGEIQGLKVQHVDLDAGIISIMDAKAGTRQTVVSDALLDVLSVRIAGKRADDLVFNDAPQRTVIEKHFHWAVKRLGFNDGVEDRRHKLVFHSLRHTFASWLVQSGVPLYTVADLMGHSTITMTQRYAKLAQDNRREAVALIGKI